MRPRHIMASMTRKSLPCFSHVNPRPLIVRRHHSVLIWSQSLECRLHLLTILFKALSTGMMLKGEHGAKGTDTTLIVNNNQCLESSSSFCY